jgi:hypothetical protein
MPLGRPKATATSPPARWIRYEAQAFAKDRVGHHWSPLQADFLATDWELCIRGIQREMEVAESLDAHHALITG